MCRFLLVMSCDHGGNGAKKKEFKVLVSHTTFFNGCVQYVDMNKNEAK